MVPFFHLNDIVLLSLCVTPKQGIVLMWLGLSESTWQSWSIFHKMESIFLQPGGPHRAHPASCSTITNWMMGQLISMSYILKETVPYFPICTSAVGISRAI